MSAQDGVFVVRSLFVLCDVYGLLRGDLRVCCGVKRACRGQTVAMGHYSGDSSSLFMHNVILISFDLGNGYLGN